jgi:hypothetical protein
MSAQRLTDNQIISGVFAAVPFVKDCIIHCGLNQITFYDRSYYDKDRRGFTIDETNKISADSISVKISEAIEWANEIRKRSGMSVFPTDQRKIVYVGRKGFISDVDPTNKQTMIQTTSLKHYTELKAKGVSVQLVTKQDLNGND